MITHKSVQWGSLALSALLLALPFLLGAQSKPPAIEFVRFTPVAIWGDGTDTSTIEVRVTGSVTAVAVTSPFTLELFDDGTRGDTRAGDQIFSRSGVTSLSAVNTTLFPQIRVIASTGISSFFPLESILWVVSPSGRVAVSRLSEDVQVASHIVNFRDDGRLTRYTPSTSTTSPLNLATITRQFYEYFTDAYDFISILTSFGAANGANFHIDARNDVQGIGKSIFNSTATFGSAGRLMGVNFTPLQAGALTHEVTHQWAAFLDRSLELGDGAHWGAVNIPGYVFGINFRSNDNGTYTITQGVFEAGRLHPPMELYLMGLIPPEEVPDATVLRGVSANSVQVGQVVTPTAVRTVSIAEVIALHGPRIPSVSTSQKHFRMAGVLITPGRLATEVEMAAYNRMLEQYGSDETVPTGDLGVVRPPFAFGTGNRARMDTTVVNPGPPTEVSERSIPTSGGSTLSWYTAGSKPQISTGYARIAPVSANFVLDGLAIFGSRENGALVSEASVPASAPITRGRVFAEMSAGVNIGLALANPNTQPAVISFYFTDAAGRDLGQSSMTIAPGAQLARLLNQEPFHGPTSFVGTMTFSSTVPIGAIALRGLTNQRGEFLMTTLPVIDPAPALPDPDTPLIIPHFADGGGWHTQVLLVNPTEASIGGTVEFWRQGSLSSAAPQVSYTLPSKSSRRIQMPGTSEEVITGFARILPATGNRVPSALVVFFFIKDGVTVSEAGIQAVRPAGGAAMYAQMYSPSRDTGSIQTGVAFANPRSSAVTVTLGLTGYDGAPTINAASVTVPANSQSTLFLNEISGFETLNAPVIFQGTLNITATGSGIAVVGLRGRYNERGDFLITSVPALASSAPTSAEKLFPHIVDGGGYSTQFVFPNLFTGGAVVRFYGSAGQAMPLPLR
jgi:hypothetical protein